MNLMGAAPPIPTEAWAGTWQMWVTMVVAVAAIWAYSLERVRVEVTSIALLAFLLIFFQLFPVMGPHGENALASEDLLAGFGNPALVAIIALLIVGQGLFQTGAFEAATRWLLAVKNPGPGIKLVIVLAAVMVISAFLNNTPVVIMFIPIASALAAKAGRSDPEVMMPLSFVCVLGGMTTLIGSSTNLLVADLYRHVTGDKINFFDFSVLGIILAGAGFVYIFLTDRFLLPSHAPEDTDAAAQDGKQFIAQFRLGYDHPLVGARAKAGMFPDLPNMTLRMIQRGEERILPPYDDMSLRADDVLIVASTRKNLTEFLTKSPNHQSVHVGISRAPGHYVEAYKPAPKDATLIEAVVAPGSRLINRPLGQAGFLYESDCRIVGIQRRTRMTRSPIHEIRLEAGDNLLIYGPQSEIRTLRSNRDIILLEWSSLELPAISHAKRAQVVFAIMVVCAALGIVPIVVAAVLAAVVMILLGCLNVRQAIRAVDQRIFLLIGSALALGLCLERTGGAGYLAHSLVTALQGQSIPIILSAFFLLIAALTNLLSNNATAVLMTPIALSTAHQLNVDPLPFVYTVIFAANCSFATPISYQTNLLVMGPGRYNFVDFLKFGGPLLLLLWITYSFVAPIYFGLG